MSDGRQASWVGNGRHDHFAARGQPKRGNRDEQRSGACRHSVRIAAAHLLNECVGVALFKLALIAWIEPPLSIVGNNVLDCRGLGIAQGEPRRHGALAHRIAACDRKLFRRSHVALHSTRSHFNIRRMFTTTSRPETGSPAAQAPTHTLKERRHRQ